MSSQKLRTNCQHVWHNLCTVFRLSSVRVHRIEDMRFRPVMDSIVHYWKSQKGQCLVAERVDRLNNSDSQEVF